MSGLWTNGLDALTAALHRGPSHGYNPTCERVASHLIDSGVVRVLDPDDTELVERVAAALWVSIYREPWAQAGAVGDRYRVHARAVVKALRQP
jgi:hypothetical protein